MKNSLITNLELYDRYGILGKYTQALIGAIKRCDRGVSITMVTKLNFSMWQNTAGGDIVPRVFPSPATYGKHRMRIHCKSITWINSSISETKFIGTTTVS